jgi:hypothetical protein
VACQVCLKYATVRDGMIMSWIARVEDSPKDNVCFFPKILNSALPSFSMPFTQAWMRAGVAASSAMSRISPVDCQL